MAIKVYKVYGLNAQGNKEYRATIIGDKVTGPQAESVRKELEGGFRDKVWPKDPPEQIIFGDYMWVELG